MKKKKTKLVFKKHSITELTDSQITKVNGGCQWGDSSGATVTINTSINTSVVSITDNTSIILPPDVTVIGGDF